MSIIKICHGERRTTQCIVVRDLTVEMDGPILAWIPPGEEQELDMVEGTELVLTMQ